MDQFEFVEVVGDWLERNGKTRAWLVSETGLKRATVYSWFDRGSRPTVNDAVEVAHIMGVSVESLVGKVEKGADPFLAAERDLILDLKELEPDQLAFIRRQVANEANEARRRRQTASGS